MTLILWSLLACSGGAPTDQPAAEPAPPAPPPTAPATCREAWTEASALGSVEGATLPSEAQFLRACALLPEPARPCLSMAWYVDHPKDCSEAVDGLDEELQEQIEGLLESTP